MTPIVLVGCAMLVVVILLFFAGIKGGDISEVRAADGKAMKLKSSWPLKIYMASGLISSKFAINNTLTSVATLAHGGQGGAHQKVMLAFTTVDYHMIWGVDMTPENAKKVGKELLAAAEYMESFGGKT